MIAAILIILLIVFLFERGVPTTPYYGPASLISVLFFVLIVILLLSLVGLVPSRW